MSSNQPKVSICIPSYNAAKYIETTIKSVLDSTYKNLELIINDDCSTDNTKEIVESFNDDRVYFYQNETRQGVPKNWNCAMSKASGKYAGLLNHDDIYYPFWISFVVHTLEKNPHIGWMATTNHIINDDKVVLKATQHFSETGEISLYDATRCVGKLNGLGVGVIAKREIIEEIGFYDEDTGPGADNYLYLSLAVKVPLYYSSFPHAAWRLHDNNLTYSWERTEQTAEGLLILDKIFDNPTLSEEIKQLKQSACDYFYSKAHARADELRDKDKIEAAEHIMSLIYKHGYKGRNSSA